MIEPGWKRVCGVHFQEDGDIAAVWMALDGDSDVVHLYDSCQFKREPIAVIADGMNARGRWIPIAWIDEPFAQKLLDLGFNTLTDKTDDSVSMSELTSREIEGRMRTGRFKVGKHLAGWKNEFSTFNRSDSKVPRDSHPLMAATRYAVAELQYARAEQAYRSATKTYPKVAMI